MMTSVRESSRTSCAMQTIPKIVAAVRSAITFEFMGASFNGSTCGLEQFDGIPVRIFDLDLASGRSCLQVVPEGQAYLLQLVDECGKILDPQHQSIPTAGLLRLSARHRSRPGRFGTAQQKIRVSKRQRREGGKMLVLQCEAKMRRVERDRARHILD